MPSAVLIANPAASGFTGGLHRSVVRILRRRFEVSPVWPRSALDARAMAHQAGNDRVDLVAAMGGDGIVHQVAGALAGTDTTLAILPAGTTNVYARLLGIPTSTEKAARMLVDGMSPEPQPLLRIEALGGGESSLHYAVFAAGLGFDAEIVEAAESEPYRKYRFASWHYARTSLGLLWQQFGDRLPHLRVRAGNRAADAAGLMVQFRSAYTFLGPVPLKLHPQPPSPMTVLVVERLRLLRAGEIVTRAALGRNLGDVEGLSIWQEVDRLEVEADPMVALQADGESLGRIDRALLTFLPAGLRVARPLSRRAGRFRRRAGAARPA